MLRHTVIQTKLKPFYVIPQGYTTWLKTKWKDNWKYLIGHLEIWGLKFGIVWKQQTKCFTSFALALLSL